MDHIYRFQCPHRSESRRGELGRERCVGDWGHRFRGNWFLGRRRVIGFFDGRLRRGSDTGRLRCEQGVQRSGPGNHRGYLSRGDVYRGDFRRRDLSRCNIIRDWWRLHTRGGGKVRRPRRHRDDPRGRVGGRRGERRYGKRRYRNRGERDLRIRDLRCRRHPRGRTGVSVGQRSGGCFWKRRRRRRERLGFAGPFEMVAVRRDPEDIGEVGVARLVPVGWLGRHRCSVHATNGPAPSSQVLTSQGISSSPGISSPCISGRGDGRAGDGRRGDGRDCRRRWKEQWGRSATEDLGRGAEVGQISDQVRGLLHGRLHDDVGSPAHRAVVDEPTSGIRRAAQGDEPVDDDLGMWADVEEHHTAGEHRRSLFCRGFPGARFRLEGHRVVRRRHRRRVE
jgi:hypothetical protein